MYQGLQTNLAVYYAKARPLQNIAMECASDEMWQIVAAFQVTSERLIFSSEKASRNSHGWDFQSLVSLYISYIFMLFCMLFLRPVTSEAGRRGLERKNAPKVFLEGQELPLRQATGRAPNPFGHVCLAWQKFQR